MSFEEAYIEYNVHIGDVISVCGVSTIIGFYKI